MRFQSAPGAEAGGNVGSASATPRSGFNPPPAVRPGETRPPGETVAPDLGFNPPPAVRPGGTVAGARRGSRRSVSIRPRR